MKTTFFRSAFFTAGTMLQAVALLCVFLSVSPVHAVPQFGRPLFHALDAPTPSRLALPLAPFETPSTSMHSATVAGTAIPSHATGDQVNAASASSSSSSSTPSMASSSVAPSSTGTSTSGASHSLGGVPAALVLTAAASAVLLVF